MSDKPTFRSASPYQNDILALPVTDLDTASVYYSTHFGLTETERRDNPPTVTMERDGTQIGFAITGEDASE
ncbi:MAG TPA: VOC family protein, partial [Candidatus Latescibacteria bacterium]|nr:VOC family protein [Candidatus Latescibacterota bacterium]